MALTLRKKVDLFLKSNMGRYFTAKEIAQHLVQLYPEEFRAKLEKSTVLADIDSLVTQVSYEISGQCLEYDSRFPNISCTLYENRRHYYAREHSNSNTQPEEFPPWAGFRVDGFASPPEGDTDADNYADGFRVDGFASSPEGDTDADADADADNYADGFRVDGFASSPEGDTDADADADNYADGFRVDGFASSPEGDADADADNDVTPDEGERSPYLLQKYENIEGYRSRLLDTTRKNNLITLAHTASSFQYVRVVDEVPELLYEKLMKGTTLTLKPLPEDDNIPDDERSEEFLHTLKQMQLTDEDYGKAMDGIDEGDDSYAAEVQRAERTLRNKVRYKLELPEWGDRKVLTNAEIAAKHGINPSYDLRLRKGETSEKRHSDNYIQTLLKSEEMSSKLSKMNSAINNDISSSGVNTFYMAFGFLRWYDSENVKKPYTSPLVMLQLEMTKKKSKAGFVYQLQSIGEEPQINLSLVERLKSDFGMQLPDLREDQPLEDYLSSIEACITGSTSLPGKNHWRVYRFVTLGRFHFARLVMYHDLNNSNWSEEQNPAAASIIKNLLVGTDDLVESGYAKDYNIDTPEVDEVVPLIVTPADASQHSAIVDAMKGKSMVIQGPPGTGKSQTITNIIANALYQGKTVLFLAEKMAALNVVYERLNHASLGDFCLELHSVKAKKTSIIQSIKRRIELKTHQESNSLLEQKISERERQRCIVTDYVNAVNDTLDNQQRTNHDYLWALQLSRGRLGGIVDELSFTKPTFDEAKQEEGQLVRTIGELSLIAKLKMAVDKVSSQGVHPWSFVQVFEQNQSQLVDLKDSMRGWAKELLEVTNSYKNTVPDLYQDGSTTLTSIGEFLDNTEGLAEVNIASLDLSIMEHLGSRLDAESFITLIDKLDARADILQRISSLKNPTKYLSHIEGISRAAGQAASLEVQNLTAAGIASKVIHSDHEVAFWVSATSDMKKASAMIGLKREGMTLEGAKDVIAIIQYIASIPREIILARTLNIIREVNYNALEQAAKMKFDLDQQVKQYSRTLDISMLGNPMELRKHAANISDAGRFPFLKSSYRQAKKAYKLASIKRGRFISEVVAEIFLGIATTKEGIDALDTDTRLKRVCGDTFSGYQTDFQTLHETSKWAMEVRQKYSMIDDNSAIVQKWLLNASVSDINAVGGLHHSQNITLVRSSFENAKIDKPIGQPLLVEAYCNNLKKRSQRLLSLQKGLESIALSEVVTFEDIRNDIPLLKKLEKVSLLTSGEDSFRKKVFGTTPPSNATRRTQKFIKDAIDIAEVQYLWATLFNPNFSQQWQSFLQRRMLLQERYSNAEKYEHKLRQTTNHNFKVLLDVERGEDAPVSNLVDVLIDALNAPEATLKDWMLYNKALKGNVEGVSKSLIDLFASKDLNFELLPIALEYVIYNSIVQEIYLQRLTPLNANSLILESARKKFEELEEDIVKLQKDRLYAKLSQKRVLPGLTGARKSRWTEGPLIEHEVSKTTRHIPIRKLIARAPTSMQSIKPCFLMSPLSVAQYLEPQKIAFDIVIIDEASQMYPEDALGSVLRSKQIIVVGDPQQLPPTPFFKSENKNDDEDEDGDALIPESIMDMAIQTFRPPRLLSRHYRSQHESLIAFSNHYFYDEELILFPSPTRDRADMGFQLKYVGGIYSGRSNMTEVKAVVEAALLFMKEYPDRSLGIATINQKQQQLVEMEMDTAFIKHNYANDYRTHWQDTLESFFVKNLESVQGDERDAIFISTVYGPSETNGVVRQNFGPVSRDLGYRRLNVLFTRAKKNMVVFTSLRSTDINITEKSKQGARALKNFLRYGEDGTIEKRRLAEVAPESDLELFFERELKALGCTVVPRVGIGSYKIDLGVKHPKLPSGFLMGIECDGAIYHASKSARERDIIRQKVLENLGWNIYRIWSIDWTEAPLDELDKLVKYIKKLLENIDENEEYTKDIIDNKVTAEGVAELATETEGALGEGSGMTFEEGIVAELEATPKVTAEGVPDLATETEGALGEGSGMTFEEGTVADLEDTLGTTHAPMAEVRLINDRSPDMGISDETVEELTLRRERVSVLSLSNDLVPELTPEAMAERDPIALKKIVSKFDFDTIDDLALVSSQRVQINDHVDFLVIKGSEEELRSAQIIYPRGDPELGTISTETPLGKALLSCYVGEEIPCILPTGEVALKVLRIREQP